MQHSDGPGAPPEPKRPASRESQGATPTTTAIAAPAPGPSPRRCRWCAWRQRAIKRLRRAVTPDGQPPLTRFEFLVALFFLLLSRTHLIVPLAVAVLPTPIFLRLAAVAAFVALLFAARIAAGKTGRLFLAPFMALELGGLYAASSLTPRETPLLVAGLTGAFLYFALVVYPPTRLRRSRAARVLAFLSFFAVLFPPLCLFWAVNCFWMTVSRYGAVIGASVPFFAWVTLTCALPSFLLATARKDDFVLRNAAHFCFSTPLIIFLASAAVYYWVRDSSAVPTICAQPGVSAIYTYDSRQYYFRELRYREVRNIVEGCTPGSYLLTTHGSPTSVNALLAINPEAQTARRYAFADPDEGIEVDCERGVVYSQVHVERRIAKVDLASGQGVRGPFTAHGDILRLALSPDRRSLLALRESHRLEAYDPDSLEPRGFIPFAPFRFAYREPELFVSGHGVTAAFRLTWNPPHRRPSAEEIWSAKPPRSVKGHIAVHPRLPYLFKVTGDALYQLDTNTGEVLRRRQLDEGLRYLSVSPDGSAVLVPNQITGWMDFVEPTTLATMSRVFVGKRSALVNYSRDGKYALLPSLAGGFKLALSAEGEDAP